MRDYVGKVRVGLCARTLQSVLHRRIRKREGCVSRRHQGCMFRILENNKGGSERGSLSQSCLISPVTGVKYPLLRACSSSAALRAAGLHTHHDTHVRTHRTSSDPAYLHTYVYLYMKREEEECCYFRNPGLKRPFG